MLVPGNFLGTRNSASRHHMSRRKLPGNLRLRALIAKQETSPRTQPAARLLVFLRFQPMDQLMSPHHQLAIAKCPFQNLAVQTRIYIVPLCPLRLPCTMFSVSVFHKRVCPLGYSAELRRHVSVPGLLSFAYSRVGFAQPTGDLAFHLSGFRVSLANEIEQGGWWLDR